MLQVKDLLEFRIDSYSPETRFKTKVDGASCEIRYFGGKNKTEYEIAFTDGRHRLFNNGMIQMEWNEVGGKKAGIFTVFEFGFAKYMGKWENLNNAAEIPHIVNLKKGKILEIINRKTGAVVYRGGFTKSWLRHGLGIEYNKDSGEVEYECLWENGKRKKYLKEFIGDKMIEYSSGSSNLTPSETSPVYYGEYFFVESTGEFLRHGVGYEIEKRKIETYEVYRGSLGYSKSYFSLTGEYKYHQYSHVNRDNYHTTKYQLGLAYFSSVSINFGNGSIRWKNINWKNYFWIIKG